MYFYFSADYPAVIKLDGIYYGSITHTLKQLNVDSSSFPFVEVCSLNSTQASMNFILDQALISNPPENICVTDMKGGFLIKLTPSFCGGAFSVINQTKFNDCVCTVFNDNGYKLSIETPNDFYAETLPFAVKLAKFHKCENTGNKLLGVAMNENPTVLNIYSLSNKIKKVYSSCVESFTFNDTLNVIETFKDIAKHTREVCWQFNNTIMQEKSVKVWHSPNFSMEKLPQQLLPYAFLEELLVGGDYTCYLSDNIKENASMLRQYFGTFIGIMPPPIFRSPNEVGVIYKKYERQYYVDYFTFEFENKKITNVKKSD